MRPSARVDWTTTTAAGGGGSSAPKKLNHKFSNEVQTLNGVSEIAAEIRNVRRLNALQGKQIKKTPMP